MSTTQSLHMHEGCFACLHALVVIRCQTYLAIHATNSDCKQWQTLPAPAESSFHPHHPSLLSTRLVSAQITAPSLPLVGEFVACVVSISVSQAMQAASLDLALRSPMGATPAQITLLAFIDSKLHALPAEGHTIAVPPIAAGGTHTIKLWIRSPLPVTTRLVASLSCPATVVSTAQLQFEEPFEHVARLFSETHVHTLVSPSHAYNSSEPGSAVPLVIGQAVMVQVQAISVAVAVVTCSQLPSPASCNRRTLPLSMRVTSCLALSACLGAQHLAIGSSLHCYCRSWCAATRFRMLSWSSRMCR